MNVYFRNKEGKLSQFESPKEDHAEAILEVCEALVASGEGYDKPVLAVIAGKPAIDGGKK